MTAFDVKASTIHFGCHILHIGLEDMELKGFFSSETTGHQIISSTITVVMYVSPPVLGRFQFLKNLLLELCLNVDSL